MKDNNNDDGGGQEREAETESSRYQTEIFLSPGLGLLSLVVLC